MSTGNVQLSTTEYVRINTELNPVMLQAHRDSVRIVFSELKPVRSNPAFHLLGGEDDSLQLPYLDSNVWVLAMSSESSLTVTEYSRLAVSEIPKTSSNAVAVESRRTITQVSAHHGTLNKLLTTVEGTIVGTVGVENNMFVCDSGTAIDGFASLLTSRQATSKAGYDAIAEVQAVFSTGAPGNLQAAGLVTATNTFAFANVFESFGIRYAYNGADELQELTLTAVGGSETVTITINGINYSVNLTGIGTVQDDAYEISESLNTLVTGYIFTSNNDQVIAQSVLARPQGVFNYTSAGSSVGNWVQITQGVGPSTVFIPQSQWNQNLKSDLDHTLGNTYRIRFSLFGVTSFYIKDMNSDEFILVHMIKHANSSVLPSVSVPTFRAGWFTANFGGNTDVRIQGSSVATFTEGDDFHSNSASSDSHDQIGVSTLLTNIITLRNRISFNGNVNRVELLPLELTMTSQTNKTAFFKVLLNPVFASTVVYDYVNKTENITEITKDSVLVTGGQEIATVSVVNGTPGKLMFNESFDRVTTIAPGDVICLAAQMSSGAASDCQASFTWLEDL